MISTVTWCLWLVLDTDMLPMTCSLKNKFYLYVSAYISFIVHHLDLSGVTEFDHCADRHLKLPTSLQVQPDIVALKGSQTVKQSNRNQDVRILGVKSFSIRVTE